MAINPFGKREEASKKKKAFGTETQQSVGAQMSTGDAWAGLRQAKSPGASPEAPTSVGQLMTPSTFGREAPAGSEEELGQRVERNKSFLSNPDTQAALMQFGIAMLSTAGSGNFASNFGKSAALALTMKGRMAKAGEEDELKKLTITEKKLDIAKKAKELANGESADPTELMRLLDEADREEKEGNFEAAAILRSRAYQMSQEFSLTQGQILKPPSSFLGGGGNSGIVGDGKGANTTGPTIENIPGGVADMEMQAAQDKVAAKKMDDIQKGGLIGAAVDEINQVINASVAPNFTITGLGGLLQYIPANPVTGGGARRVSGLIDLLHANAGFTQLQALRDASPTGGALGPVSDLENRLLQSTLANLDQLQKSGDLQKGLSAIKFLFDPMYVEARNKLSQALKSKEITTDEAVNTFNSMYRQAITGMSDADAAAGAGAGIDLSIAPVYLEERFKPLWQDATPEQKRQLLNEEDRIKFDKAMAARGVQ